MTRAFKHESTACPRERTMESEGTPRRLASVHVHARTPEGPRTEMHFTLRSPLGEFFFGIVERRSV